MLTQFKFLSLGALLLLATLSACTSNPQKTQASQQPGSAGLAQLSPSQQSLYQSALAAMDQGDYQQAAEGLQSLLREQPGVAELHLNLAIARYRQEQFAQAASSVAQALNANPELAPAHNLKGLLAVEQGQFKNAQAHYQQALALDSDYSHALYNMALLQDVYLQDIAKAVDYYDRYLQLVDNDEDTKNWTEQLRHSLEQ